MVCRLIEGWESSTVMADYTGKWTAPGTGTVSAAAGRFGNGHRVSVSAHTSSRTFDNQGTWVIGFALRIGGFPAGAPPLIRLSDGGTAQCGIHIPAGTGQIAAFRNTPTTVLGTTASAVLTPNVWAYVEAKLVISDTGSVVVRVNGTPVLSLPSVDTRASTTVSTANVVEIGALATISTNFDYDDVYILDGTGTVNNDFLGDCKVEQVLPTGAGATTAWTPSAGSNWDCVNEAPPNADTDYVASATAGQTDTYAFGDLTVTGTVKAVQATAQARKDDAGSRSIALVARPGSTDRVGATQAVGDSYALYPQVWDTNPDTAAAWTAAEVAASQFGQRLIA